MQSILAWVRQTTTVQGLAVLALTVVLQLTQAVPLGVVIATAATSLVLLILPGQGDLAGKIGVVVSDAMIAVASKGDKAALGKLAVDGLSLESGLAPQPSAAKTALTNPTLDTAAIARNGVRLADSQLG